jgi:iodotyrosine deiodinase
MQDHPTLAWYPYSVLSDQERIANAQDFYEMIKSRRSCRHIGDAPVPRGIIELPVRAAGTAPSGANHQSWHFAIVSSPTLKHDIRIAAEEEERTVYAGKASEEWLGALEPLGTDAEKPVSEIASWL